MGDSCLCGQVLQMLPPIMLPFSFDLLPLMLVTFRWFWGSVQNFLSMGLCQFAVLPTSFSGFFLRHVQLVIFQEFLPVVTHGVHLGHLRRSTDLNSEKKKRDLCSHSGFSGELA